MLELLIYSQWHHPFKQHNVNINFMTTIQFIFSKCDILVQTVGKSKIYKWERQNKGNCGKVWYHSCELLKGVVRKKTVGVTESQTHDSCVAPRRNSSSQACTKQNPTYLM